MKGHEEKGVWCTGKGQKQNKAKWLSEENMLADKLSSQNLVALWKTQKAMVGFEVKVRYMVRTSS